MVIADGRWFFSDRDSWIADAREAIELFRAGEISFWAAQDLLDESLAIIATDDLTEDEFYPLQDLFDALYDAVHEDDEATDESQATDHSLKGDHQHDL